jgi:hypothetical protein
LSDTRPTVSCWRATLSVVGYRKRGVEVIEVVVAALAAGASAGLTNAGTAAVQDAYAALKKLLKPWVRGEARAALDTDETDEGVWRARLGEELKASGAAEDEQVLAAAKQLLALADPEKAKTFHISVGTNYGAVGEFSGAVTFNQGPPVPPSPPATK